MAPCRQRCSSVLKVLDEGQFRIKHRIPWRSDDIVDSAQMAILFLTQCHAPVRCDVPGCRFVEWLYMRPNRRGGPSYRMAAVYEHDGVRVYQMTTARIVE